MILFFSCPLTSVRFRAPYVGKYTQRDRQDPRQNSERMACQRVNFLSALAGICYRRMIAAWS